MPGPSVAFKNSMLDALLNQTNLTAPTTIYLSLHTGDPSTTGANELTVGTDANYVRQLVTTSFPAASSGSCSSNVNVLFAASAGSYTITHWGLWSASSGGTFYFGGTVTPNQAISAGVVPEFLSGNLTVS